MRSLIKVIKFKIECRNVKYCVNSARYGAFHQMPPGIQPISLTQSVKFKNHILLFLFVDFPSKFVAHLNISIHARYTQAFQFLVHKFPYIPSLSNFSITLVHYLYAIILISRFERLLK